jgi:hypothetical protein
VPYFLFILFYFLQKKKEQKHGIIRVGAKGGRGSGTGYATVPDSSFLSVPVFSKGNERIIKGKQLSPFFLGPIKEDVENNVPECKILENYWQFSKVFGKVAKQQQKNWKHNAETHVSDMNTKTPLPAWYAWRKKGFQNSQAVRRPNGTVRKHGPPLYCFFKGKRFNYIDSRKQLYQPMYKELVRKTPAYKALLCLIKDQKTNVLLIEPDGPNVEKFPNGTQVDRKMLKKLIENDKIIYGHGYCLADALLEDLGEEE